ncbi:MAG: succinylglutamate desuccinylase/aspartoacylase family protein [Planctomycetota bacterium]
MNGDPAAPDIERAAWPREIGRYTSGQPGPAIVVIGGLHGNEPAGVHAARRVIEALHENQPTLRGTFVALCGNRAGLARGRRFVDLDLNRCWEDDAVAALRDRDPSGDSAEHAEQRELLACIEELAATTNDPLVLLDLHTTSGNGPPFLLMADALSNRSIAMSLPGTIVLGLEEEIDGALVCYFGGLGHRAIVFEGGQHDDKKTVEHSESAIWLTLVAVGALSESDIPEFELKRRALGSAAADLPRVVELRYRHRIRAGDRFKMQPGFEGLARVRRGDVLASDIRGDVTAPESGRLLMPLYQDQGSDGFFLCRRVSAARLDLSTVCRRAQLHRLLPLLPGVSRGSDPNTMRTTQRGAARFRELLRFFGYRRERARENGFSFSRRRSDSQNAHARRG